MRVTIKMSRWRSQPWSIMKNTSNHSDKNLEDRCLGFLRQGQSILQGKEVFKDQSWKDSQQRAEAFHSGGCLFTGRHIVSGVIATKGHLLVCFEESRVKGIAVHPFIFDDIKGRLNVIYDIHRLNQNHIIQVFVRAGMNYWKTVWTFSSCWERRIQILFQWEPWSAAAGGSEMILEDWDYHYHSKMYC